jgi:serine/threonine protein kinase
MTLSQSTLQGTANTKGTPIYCAPEMIMNIYESVDKAKSVAKASRKTDIYAFALLAWEILSQKKPFSHVTSEPELCMTVHRGIRPPLEELPADTPKSIVDMIRKAWDKDRSIRPSAVECYTICRHFYEIKSQENFEIFLSHSSSSRAFLSYVYAEFTRNGYRVWFDLYDSGTDMQSSAKSGIINSKIVLACVDNDYQQLSNCIFELKTASEIHNKTIVTLSLKANIDDWARKDLASICDLQSKQLFLDMSNISELGWGSDEGPSKTMLEQLKLKMKSLYMLLSSLECNPNSPIRE